MLKLAGIENANEVKWVNDEKCLILMQAVRPFDRGNMHVRQDILEWVKRGNTLLVLKEADKLAEWLAGKEVVDYRGRKDIRKDWYGGNYLVKEHPIFKDLPVNVAFNWEYQCLADYRKERYGLRIENGEWIVAVTADHKPEVYASVLIIPHGKGKVILSTLDLQAAIMKNDKPSIVAKKILQNMVKFAVEENGTR